VATGLTDVPSGYSATNASAGGAPLGKAIDNWTYLPRGVARVRPRYTQALGTSGPKSNPNGLVTLPGSTLFHQVGPDIFKPRKTKSLVLGKEDHDERPVANPAIQAAVDAALAPDAAGFGAEAHAAPKQLVSGFDAAAPEADGFAPTPVQPALLNVMKPKPQHADAGPIGWDGDEHEYALELPSLGARYDYYMLPFSEEQIQEKYSHDVNAIKINDFTIGRKGCGSIRWLGQTDVRGLDIEQNVRLEPLEVFVYEDPQKKPDQGEKLNKTAEITFEGLDQNERIRKKIEKSGSSASEYLRSKTEKMDAKFISYEDGVWKIQVEHFSRYGLSDSDDDDEPAGQPQGGLPPQQQLQMPPRQQLQMPPQQQLQMPGGIPGGMPNFGIPQQQQLQMSSPNLNRMNQSQFGQNLLHSSPALRPPFDSPALEGLNQPVPRQPVGSLGMDAASMHRLRDSLFPRGPSGMGSPADAVNQSAISLVQAQVAKKRATEFPILFTPPHTDPACEDDRSFSPPPAQHLRDGYEPPTRRLFKKAYAEQEKKRREKLQTQIRSDVGLFMGMGRGFRCSWGPNGQLVYPSGVGKDEGGKQKVQMINLNALPNLGLLEHIDETQCSTYVAELEVSLDATSAAWTMSQLQHYISKYGSKLWDTFSNEEALELMEKIRAKVRRAASEEGGDASQLQRYIKMVTHDEYGNPYDGQPGLWDLLAREEVEELMKTIQSKRMGLELGVEMDQDMVQTRATSPHLTSPHLTSPAEGDHVYTLSPLTVSWEYGFGERDEVCSEIHVELIFHGFSCKLAELKKGCAELKGASVSSTFEGGKCVLDMPSWAELMQKKDQHQSMGESTRKFGWCCVKLTCKNSAEQVIQESTSPDFMVLGEQ
jgi:hypothetical protein